MKEFDNEMGRNIDRAIFKTENPEKIRKTFLKSFNTRSQECSTLGGYLRDIRLLRGLTTEECAQKVGVARACWQSWEGDRETPSEPELFQLCRGMEFGETKREELLRLKARAPRHRLLAISRLRPEFLAARGVARIESSLEWEKLPRDVQNALSNWGRKQGINSFEEMMVFFLSLPDEDSRESWVDEVLAGFD